MQSTRSRGSSGRSRPGSNDGARLLAELLATVAAANKEGQPDRAHLDVEVQHKGKQIILPAEPTPMPIPDAISVLQSMHEEQEQDVAISEVIRDAHYIDSLVAFTDAMEEVFGWTQAVPVRTFFGDILPEYVDIPVSLTEVRRIIKGRFNMPNVPGYVETRPEMHKGLVVLKIQGTTVRKFQPLYAALAEATRRRVKERSIFRNQAFELLFDDDGNISSDPPQFIDVSGSETPIFSRYTEKAIQANILTPIEQTERVRKMGVPIKRGILLEGPYGTGKTLVSRQTGQTCLKHGWTFVVIRDATHVAGAIEFARRFQPACVFVEDIDREVGTEDRDTKLDRILNTMDGVDSKNSDVMIVFTSNHAETINQAMLRPGRLDAVITIDAPDAEAALRLATVYAKGLLDPDLDYTEAGESLSGKSAAVIREVVERAKLYAVGEIPEGEKLMLTPTSLADSAATMDRQLALLSPKEEAPKDAGTRFIEAVAEAVQTRLVGADDAQAASLTGAVVNAARAASQAAENSSETLDVVQKGSAGGDLTARRVKDIHEAVC